MLGKGNSFRITSWLVLVAFLISATGCNEKKAEQTFASNAEVTGSAATAEVVTQASWTPDVLEELVAPIALYPDPLVGQILAASVNAQEVLDAGNWLLDHKDLKGDALDAATEKLGLGPAMRALCHFPDVVDMMCQQLDWTKQLGAAFTSDQKSVLDAIQRLRTAALNVGNLKSSKEQKVEQTVQEGQPVVTVQPADPKVVYVPQYDPQVVYVQAPATTATTEEHHEENNDGSALAGALVGFGIGMLVGSTMNSYCYPAWGYGSVYYGPRPFYPPAYGYHPYYGGGFNHVNHYSNRNVNVNVNNNYFNRFDGNRNLGNNRGRDNNNRGNAGNRSPIASTRPANNNKRAGAGNSSRRQNTYRGKNANNKMANDQTRNSVNPNNRGANTDRGYGGSNRATASNNGYRGASNTANRAGAGSSGYRGASNNAASRPSASTGGIGQGAAQVSRPSAGTNNVGAGNAGTRVANGGGAGPSVSQQNGANVVRSSGGGARDTGLSGAGGSGGFERSASARGRASASSSGMSSRSSGGRSGGGGGGGRGGRR
jgi:hypothetical protein